MRKLWLGVDYKDGNLVWTEGTPVRWTNWDKGRRIGLTGIKVGK